MIVIVGLAVIVAIGGWSLRGRRPTPSTLAEAPGLGVTVDLVSVVIGSGGTVRQAVETVAEYGPQPVASSFAAVLDDAAGVMLLADALDRLSIRLGSTYHPLIGALIATERDGAPVALLLQRLADDAEQARRWQVEAIARRLPVTMLIPLVVCFLPATIIGTVVPLVLVALRHLEF